MPYVGRRQPEYAVVACRVVDRRVFSRLSSELELLCMRCLQDELELTELRRVNSLHTAHCVFVRIRAYCVVRKYGSTCSHVRKYYVHVLYVYCTFFSPFNLRRYLRRCLRRYRRYEGTKVLSKEPSKVLCTFVRKYESTFVPCTFFTLIFHTTMWSTAFSRDRTQINIESSPLKRR